MPESIRYVAIGDSFTEGVGDDLPDGSVRGWADDVAAVMARVAPVEYANLAIRGRLMEPIVDEQLEAALDLKPSLMTFNGGGNDVMRPGVDLQHLRDLTERVIIRCREAGVQLVLLSGANPSSQLPMGRVINRRGADLTRAVAELTRAHGVPFADNFSDRELSRAQYWSPDRLHLGPAGHRRVAARVLTTLGYDTPDGWMRPLEARPAPTLRENARFYRQYVGPWVLRRVRHRSSGDGRVAKYATWQPVTVDGSVSEPLADQ